MSSNSQYVWYELMTPAPAESAAFYQKVTGWTFKDAGMPDMAYDIIHAGDYPIGGAMALPDELRAAGVPAHWIAYISVDDVDQAASKAESLGGKICRAPDDIPNVGRFSVVSDPQGAVICLYKPAGDAMPVPPVETIGNISWRELHTTDVEGALTFYQAMFGWDKGETMDMGPNGIYQILQNGQVQLGGMLKKADEIPQSFWLFYANCRSIEGAMAVIQAEGGKVIMGPHPIPSGAYICMAFDPHGAPFALVGAKN
ncbi:VOC family protein [Burkholderiaceae bacterium DAT-1]|nr:VOC family protein [Burkholderiaceae bacterium DAT-1]